MQAMTPEETVQRRNLASTARKLRREGHSDAEIAVTLDTSATLVDWYVDWANQHIPLPVEEIPTERENEIAKLNVKEAILDSLWAKLGDAEREQGLAPGQYQNLSTFEKYTKIFLEIQKARRALRGMDSPIKVESRTTVVNGVSDETSYSIDAEVEALMQKFGVKPAGKPLDDQ